MLAEYIIRLKEVTDSDVHTLLLTFFDMDYIV